MKKVIVLIFLLAIFLVVPRNYFTYAEEKKSDKTNIGKISGHVYVTLGSGESSILRGLEINLLKTLSSYASRSYNGCF